MPSHDSSYIVGYFASKAHYHCLELDKCMPADRARHYIRVVRRCQRIIRRHFVQADAATRKIWMTKGLREEYRPVVKLLVSRPMFGSWS